MHTYVVLLRGINVGGKNIIPMAGLRTCLEEHGFSHVSTYIASGNVLLKSNLDADEVKIQIEGVLSENFQLSDGFIKVWVLTPPQLQAVIEHKPNGFGEQPELYHSDIIFLMGVEAAEALPAFSPREGVDRVWAGDGVVYSQRLSSERTKSRLNKIMESPLYKSMTIRNWNTTTKLLELLRKMDGQV